MLPKISVQFTVKYQSSFDEKRTQVKQITRSTKRFDKDPTQLMVLQHLVGERQAIGFCSRL